MATRTTTLPARGRLHRLSLRALAVEHRATADDLLVIRHPGQKTARLAYRLGDPDFVFEVEASLPVIVSIETT